MDKLYIWINITSNVTLWLEDQVDWSYNLREQFGDFSEEKCIVNSPVVYNSDLPDGVDNVFFVGWDIIQL